MEGMVYDFKIDNKKIQEKVGCIDKIKNTNVFSMIKSNGSRCQKNYDIGDNDFYWLNCINKVVFYVIPEHLLIERKYVGFNGKKQLKLNPKDTLYNQWLKPYRFDYENIDKVRLLKLLK